MPLRLTGPVKVILPPRVATGQDAAPPMRLPPEAVMAFGTMMSSVRVKSRSAPAMVTAPAPREPVVETARPSTLPSTKLRPT